MTTNTQSFVTGEVIQLTHIENELKKFNINDAAIANELKKFNINDAAIADVTGKYSDLKINGIEDKPGYLSVRAARLDVKGMRVKVEKTRKELVKDALDFQRLVNTEAKRLTTPLESLEKILERQETFYDQEKERIKQEEERQLAIKTQVRIDKLIALGMIFNNGRYALFSIDGSERLGMDADIILLKTMLDEEFDTYHDVMVMQADAKKAEIAEIERKKAEEAARLEQERLADEAEAAAKRAAEQAEIEHIKQEQLAIQKKLDEERSKLEESKKLQEFEAAALKVEQDRLEDEKRSIERVVWKIETTKQSEIETKAKAEELERACQEAAQKAIEEAKESERLKLEQEERRKALMPDKDKLLGMCNHIRGVSMQSLEQRFQHEKMLNIAKEARSKLLHVIGFIEHHVSEFEKEDTVS